MGTQACLLLFTKPAVPGRVKTRLIGELTAEQAAELHRAFVADLVPRLRSGRFDLRLAWALEPGQELPPGPVAGMAQEGADLGERLHHALATVSARYPYVAAVGSDHPQLRLARVEEAFELLTRGADLVLGPAGDGGYYLIALPAAGVDRRLFTGIPWSTGEVLEATLRRAGELGLEVSLLEPEEDVDTPADLARLAASLAATGPARCPHTAALLERWGRLEVPS